MAQAKGLEPLPDALEASVLPLHQACVLAPVVGFEPTALSLTARCSTIELDRNGSGGRSRTYSTHGARFTVWCSSPYLRLRSMVAVVRIELTLLRI